MSVHPHFAGILGAMSGDTAKACRARGNSLAAQNDEPEPPAQRHLRVVREVLAKRAPEAETIRLHHEDEFRSGLDSVGDSDLDSELLSPAD